MESNHQQTNQINQINGMKRNCLIYWWRLIDGGWNGGQRPLICWVVGYEGSALLYRGSSPLQQFNLFHCFRFHFLALPVFHSFQFRSFNQRLIGFIVFFFLCAVWLISERKSNWLMEEEWSWRVDLSCAGQTTHNQLPAN